MNINIVSLTATATKAGSSSGVTSAPSSESETPKSKAARAPAVPPPPAPPGGSNKLEKQEVSRENRELQAQALEALREKARKANEYFVQTNTRLEFRVSDQSGRIVVNVIDSETDEIVRQIPPDAVNRFSERVTQVKGLLFETSG